MPRGGRREKAGRKSTWKSGRRVEETTIIRVPTEFSEQLLKIAHKLDAGEIIDLATESNTIEAEVVTDFATNSTETLQTPVIDSVTESIKALFFKWDAQSQEAAQKNVHWDKARQLLDELRIALNITNELVTDSKEVEQLELTDSVTNSELVEQLELKIENDLHTELVTNSVFTNPTLDFTEEKELNELVTNSQTIDITEFSTQSQSLNELVTESSNQFVEVEPIEPIGNRLMALRIGTFQSIMSNNRRDLLEKDFLNWINSKDPDKIRWKLVCKYSDRFLKYMPEDSTPPELLETLNCWIKDNS